VVTEFTPVLSTLGGVLIGLAAVLLMFTQGRIAGISGIAARIFPPYTDDQLLNRILFLAGILLAPLLYKFTVGNWATLTITTNTPTLLLGGLLVGFGAVWGGGCTSGHGVCGLARLSKRSMVAVAVFMTTALITVLVTRHLI
jgi:uncharacterized protein